MLAAVSSNEVWQKIVDFFTITVKDFFVELLAENPPIKFILLVAGAALVLIGLIVIIAVCAKKNKAKKAAKKAARFGLAFRGERSRGFPAVASSRGRSAQPKPGLSSEKTVSPLGELTRTMEIPLDRSVGSSSLGSSPQKSASVKSAGRRPGSVYMH